MVAIAALVGGLSFIEGKSIGLDIGQAQASAQSFEQGRQQGITEGTTQTFRAMIAGGDEVAGEC